MYYSMNNDNKYELIFKKQNPQDNSDVTYFSPIYPGPQMHVPLYPSHVALL